MNKYLEGLNAGNNSKSTSRINLDSKDIKRCKVYNACQIGKTDYYFNKDDRIDLNKGVGGCRDH